MARATEPRGGREFAEVDDELVGGLRLDAVGGQCVGREVADVVGHDHLCAAADGGGEHVAIVRVGQDEPVDQVLVARNDTVLHRVAHERPGAGEPGCQLGSLTDDRVDHLVEDLLTPSGLEQAGDREAQEQVPHRRRVQHIGVVDHGKCH